MPGKGISLTNTDNTYIPTFVLRCTVCIFRVINIRLFCDYLKLWPNCYKNRLINRLLTIKMLSDMSVDAQTEVRSSHFLYKVQTNTRLRRDKQQHSPQVGCSQLESTACRPQFFFFFLPLLLQVVGAKVCFICFYMLLFV